MEYVERDNPEFKTFPLPLARIKKVMKSDEEVKVSCGTHGCDLNVSISWFIGMRSCLIYVLLLVRKC